MFGNKYLHRSQERFLQRKATNWLWVICKEKGEKKEIMKLSDNKHFKWYQNKRGIEEPHRW